MQFRVSRVEPTARRALTAGRAVTRAISATENITILFPPDVQFILLAAVPPVAEISDESDADSQKCLLFILRHSLQFPAVYLFTQSAVVPRYLEPRTVCPLFSFSYQTHHISIRKCCGNTPSSGPEAFCNNIVTRR